MTDKIIITCAVTGSIHTPTMSPHLPVTPAEIAGQAIGAAEAGAAILHLHARNPETGQPSAREADFMAFLPEIKAGCGAVLNLSTGGSAIMSLEDRLAGPLKAEPEMCSLNMGTMNFALYPLADRYDAWVHDWEQPFLRGTDDLVFKNTPRDIEFVLTQMGQQRGARFEFECYDVGHLYMLRHFADRGLVKPPYFIQFVFGVLGGIGADPENLQHMKRMADKLLATTISSPFLRRADSRSLSPPLLPAWAGMSVSGWRTISTSPRVSWPAPTRSRSPRSARLSRNSGERSQHRKKPGRCWASKGPARRPSDHEQHNDQAGGAG